MNGINNYGQVMGAMDKANAASNGIGSLMNGDLGGAAQNGLQYLMLNKMLKQNGQTGVAAKNASLTNGQKLSANIDTAIDNASSKQLNEIAQENGSVNKEGSVTPTDADYTQFQKEGLDPTYLKQELSNSGVNKSASKAVVNSANNAWNAGENSTADDMINAASKSSRDVGAAEDSSLTGKIANKLGVSSGAAKAGMAIGLGLLGSQIGGALGSAASGNTASAKAATANAASDQAAVNSAKGLQNAYQQQVANADLALGMLPGESALQGQGMQLQQNTQNQMAAQNAGQQLQNIGQQTQGGLLNGISSLVPGTQAYSNVQRANALQQQLAQQGIVAPSYSAWNAGGNMQGLGGLVSAGTGA